MVDLRPQPVSIPTGGPEIVRVPQPVASPEGTPLASASTTPRGNVLSLENASTQTTPRALGIALPPSPLDTQAPNLTISPAGTQGPQITTQQVPVVTIDTSSLVKSIENSSLNPSGSGSVEKVLSPSISNAYNLGDHQASSSTSLNTKEETLSPLKLIEGRACYTRPSGALMDITPISNEELMNRFADYMASNNYLEEITERGENSIHLLLGLLNKALIKYNGEKGLGDYLSDQGF